MLQALAYSDVFETPLTMNEVHQYTPVQATADDVARSVAAGVRHGALTSRDGLIALAGREWTLASRDRRAAASARLVRQASPYTELIGRLPFVRMVAITGSLAVASAEQQSDIDIAVVVTDGRLWLTRAAICVIARLAAMRHLRICPNLLLAETALELDQHSPYTAREVIQMRPLSGADTYRQFLRRNAWVRTLLPNATYSPAAADASIRRRGGLARRLAEAVLGSRILDPLERFEMRRKVRRLSSESRSVETRYDAHRCLGFADEHGLRTRRAVDERLGRYHEASP